jgi:very-short-patch-repair endonuclease
LNDVEAQPTRAQSPVVHVEVSHAPTLNFAMEQSGVPLVNGVRVVSSAGAPFDDLVFEVAVEPGVVPRSSHAIPKVPAYGSASLEALDVAIAPGRLRAVREAERARLEWRLRSGDRTLASGGEPIEVLAYNEWPGLRAPPALLATFVTPNEPVVSAILRRVRDRLRATLGDGALSGYQQRDPARVRDTVRALYETVQSLGLSYVGEPASFEAVGQKVRLAETILSDEMGNCLDVTLLLASCLEQMRLAPLLVVQRAHAFPGVWLIDERFPEGVVSDAARLRNAIALGQLLFLDSSTAVHDPPVPFEGAEDVARRALEADEAFLCAVDVAVVRRDRYKPLPLRDEAGEAAAEGPIRNVASATTRDILAEASREAVERPANGVAAAPQGANGEAAPDAPATLARFRQWGDKLLDLSLRNKLLNFRPDTKGVLALDVPNVARLEDLLLDDRPFELDPRPTDPRDERSPDLARARGDAQRNERLLADLDKGILHCRTDEARMLRTALHLDREARLAREEGGANVLYVAIGLLKWFESDSSSLERLAPLLLVPVQLKYVRTTRRVRLEHVAEESMPNFTLIEKMRTDFGVDLSSLANLESDESGVDVPAMLRHAREAIQRMARWEVLEDVYVGLFSFTKHLMWKDLAENAEVLMQNEVVRHIATKPKERFPDKGGEIAPERLDDEIPPAELPLVLDADSTQASAVVAALRGRSFILQGPPGTGKSQTITNVIAAAIAAGKTVLFVSEKMAALEVVHRRLHAVGLEDFCLELHSHKAQKKAVVESLGRTYDRAARANEPAWDSGSRELGELRRTLNDYVRAAHAPTPLGMTFFQASARWLSLRGAHELRWSPPDIRTLTAEELRRAIVIARELAERAKKVEPVSSHPFRDCAVDGWTAELEHLAFDALARAELAAGAAHDAAHALASRLGAPALPASSIGNLATFVQTAAAGRVPAAWRNDEAWRLLRAEVASLHDARDAQSRRRSELAKRWSDALYEVDLVEMESRFARWATAFFFLAWIFLFGARRRLARAAAADLPGNARIAADLATARRCREADDELAAAERRIERALDGCRSSDAETTPEAVIARGEVLRDALRRAGEGPERAAVERAAALADTASTSDERSALGSKAGAALLALDALEAALADVGRLLALPADALMPGDAPSAFLAARDRLRTWITEKPAFRDWALYRAACRETQAAGYRALVDAHASGAMPAREAERAIEHALISAWVRAKRDADPVLRDFDGRLHDERIARFRRADEEHVEDLARRYVVSVAERRLPVRDDQAAGSSEPGILQHELKKKTKHMALRKLLQQIPNLLVRLKPCLLMSPLSVAQYLPASGRKFDLVVFDEASQICTEDAIGAIGRGEQVIIVGDSKQLPPTSFFKRTTADDDIPDDNDFEEFESILDQAGAAGVPEQMLGWHYRSRHQDLIRFSNTQFYEDRLNVFPAARDRVADLGVKLHVVSDGAYDAGKTRTNEHEAQALVAALVEGLRAHSRDARTFGVVTFSLAQRELVEDLLEKARARHPEIEAHFSDEHPRHEKVFVKNLENVQGDERDEIYFSVAYGPDATGKMRMDFGPLNRSGGERRLNVAVTRARCQLRVFASFTADRIDRNRAHGAGAARLRAFLRYAADADAPRATQVSDDSGDFDSDFERAVFDALRASGHRVHTQVGCGAYRIDLAVVHPEQPGVYALGIECDGAAYHSGKTARDRDRLRQMVLEDQGWKLHRIWSTDWHYHRSRELERLLAAVDTAIREGVPVSADRSTDGVGEPRRTDAPPVPRERTTTPPLPLIEPSSPVVVYQRARLPTMADESDAMYRASALNELRALVGQVLEAEAPIHVDELARRVGRAFGAARVTARVRERIHEALERVAGYHVVESFVWPRDLDRANVTRVRLPEGTDAVDLELVPAEEIAAAAEWVLSRALSLPRSDLVRETAHVFRIARVGPKIELRLGAGLSLLRGRGRCEERDGRWVWRVS